MKSIAWHEANYNYLVTAASLMRAVLALQTGMAGDGANDLIAEATAASAIAEEALPAPAALDTLCGIFNLVGFERAILLLSAAMELDPTFGALCAAVNNNPHRPYPTINLAISALPGAHWETFSPHAPLRRWGLIELIERETFASSFIRINERVLHYLLGTPSLDRRLVELVEPLDVPKDLLPSHKDSALRIARILAQNGEGSGQPVLQLCGNEPDGKRSVMAWVCDWLELQPYGMKASDISPVPEEWAMLARLWDREALLGNSLLLLDCTNADARQLTAATAFAERLRSPVLVMSLEPVNFADRATHRFDIGKPGNEEQNVLWANALGTLAVDFNGQVEQVVSHFNMGINGIRSAGAEIAARALQGRGDLGAGTLWNVCRVQARSRLDDLAHRIEPRATWDDLILPEMQKATLRQVTAHVSQRMKVYQQWGFAGRSNRGLGTSALFAGPSGTGKTLSAEVIANELQLDLYHIDLSQIVSKYIGETEKNLRRIFDAAEEAGAVLLFDEADALFGKRSEVKDSHDRHANIEVSYLLQRMESYRGLAILTTNMKQALDTAFLRRIRFVVNFPFPDATNRAEIWWRVFPSATPTDGVDVNKLANLNVAGGSIWNIALNAAFLAADAGEPIRMRHLLQAARSEYVKLEKQLTDTEIRGWT